MENRINNPYEEDRRFSQYPEEMDLYFLNNEIYIKIMPQEFMEDIELRISDFPVTSSKQYHEYLKSEIMFWEKNDPEKKLNSISRKNLLDRAMRKFEEAMKSYASGRYQNGKAELSGSVSIISVGCLHSKTILAKVLLQQKEKEENFFRGLRVGLSKDRTVALVNTASDHEGFNFALGLIKHIKEEIHVYPSSIDELEKRVSEACQNYADLNRQYMKSFYDHERRILDISNHTSDHLKELESRTNSYYEKKEKRCEELEKLYGEKLKLQAPAEYWKELDDEYSQKGKMWLAFSIMTAIIMISVLIVILLKIPEIFSNDLHWLEVIKNSAIITIITSIAAYMLRLFVRMSMSSLHLARDAKERNKLTYFYLALIEKDAVSDKERAIILNSLFSRSDTGLLKGESSPTMSNNVMELVESFTQKGN